MAKNITPRIKNFSQWYLDLIQVGELADYSPVRGCMVIRPTGFAIWEKMQAILDGMFKETGHSNAYFPLLIPEGFLEKENQHIEGFSPELAVVTHGGGEKLEEPLVVRPTSETIIGHMYSKWLNSYRDLPFLINQWCNVLRWEKRTRLFLRTSEFLWQEGHTVHETQLQAQEETLKMLQVYKTFLEEYCAIPVITGEKPEHEKFPGSLTTYTLEAMVQDKKFLQSGTSHNLGQNFSKAFDIKFLSRSNKMEFAWTTSWGVSTRLIGGVIMTHGDDDGLILPPKIASTKIVIVPIFSNDLDQELVLSYVNQIKTKLLEKFDELVIKVDERTNLRAGDRFFYWLQKGVPLRIEVGPKDVTQENCVLVTRNSRNKIKVNLSELAQTADSQLELLQQELYQKALQFRKDNTVFLENYAEMKQFLSNQGGAVEAYWDGTKETALKIQEQTKATIRVILAKQVGSKKCIFSDNPARFKVLFGVSY